MNNTITLICALSLLFPLLAISCSVDTYSCKGIKNTLPVINCGGHNVQCRNSTLYVQFRRIGNFYETDNITFPQNTFKVLDPYLSSKLNENDQHLNCDFLYYFTRPVRGFYPPMALALLPNLTMFNCTANSYDFSRDVFENKYGSSHCRGSYELYYSFHPESLNRHPQNCASDGKPLVVEWELGFSDLGTEIIELSLLSVAFTHRRAAKSECFGCVMKEGSCRTVAAGSSNCSCNLQCPNGKSNGKVIVLLTACGALAFVFLAIGVFCLWLRRRKGQPAKISLFRSIPVDPSVLQNVPEDTFDNYFHTPIFTYDELSEATEGFHASKEIGVGGFGVVYKGNLKDGRVVGVKRLHEHNYRRVNHFKNEVEILNRIRHPNLVALYGCTTRDSRELLLVYEYVPNGTLADHLHGRRAPDHLLTWPIRLSIATETATALAYLHANEPQIIHRDVKTNNILLDNNFHIKVADFGLSRLFPVEFVSHVSTAPQGTPGYLDPEYHHCYQLTDKSDVYSFGVVLIELISSMAAVDMDRPRIEINLSNIAMAKIPQGLVHELVDPTLGFDTNPNIRWAVEAVAELAFRCLQSEKDLRPSMDEVRDTLVQMDNGDEGMMVKSLRSESDPMKDDASLLKSSSSGFIFSPNTVIGGWVSSRSTSNSASS